MMTSGTDVTEKKTLKLLIMSQKFVFVHAKTDFFQLQMVLSEVK